MQLRTIQIAIRNFIRDRAEMSLTVSPAGGLNIYKQNYFKNLSKVLENKYPTAIQCLGSDTKELFHSFILSNEVSTSPNLDDYGDDFVDYLIKNGFSAAASLARIDLEVFTSLKLYEKPISASKLSHITPNDFDLLMLLLNPSLRIVKIDRNSLKVWSELNKKFVIIKDLSKKSNLQKYIAICQVEDQLFLNIIPVSYFKCIEIIKDNVNLLEATANALEIDPSFSLSDFLAFCFGNNLVTGFKLD